MSPTVHVIFASFHGCGRGKIRDVGGSHDAVKIGVGIAEW